MMGKKKERGSVKKLYPQIKAMHEQGMSAQEIGDALDMGKQTILNAISVMGLAKKRPKLDEFKLIYADNKPSVLEKVIIGGKRYTDITPVFAPR